MRGNHFGIVATHLWQTIRVVVKWLGRANQKIGAVPVHRVCCAWRTSWMDLRQRRLLLGNPITVRLNDELFLEVLVVGAWELVQNCLQGASMLHLRELRVLR